MPDAVVKDSDQQALVSKLVANLLDDVKNSVIGMTVQVI